MIFFRIKQQGFSLLEFGMTTLIIAITTLASIQGFSDFFERQKQTLFMRQLYHDLKWARVEAVVLDTPVTIQAKGEWCAGWIISTSSQILKQRDGIKNCEITFSGSLALPYFKFVADGSSDYQNGHFYFYEQSTVTMQIIINQTGRVRWIS